MFGKGIYFADMVSKSANYCFSDQTNNVGLMLICEVALGDKLTLYFANPNINNLPNQQHQSVQACGLIYPTQSNLINGVYMSSGALQRANYQTALHYNEYVATSHNTFDFILISFILLVYSLGTLYTIQLRFVSSIW